MTHTEYYIKMIWSELWSDVWVILQDLNIYPDLDRAWFAWIVSQTGFLHMEYPYNHETHKDWPKAL